MIKHLVGPFGDHDTAVKYCWANYENDERGQLKGLNCQVKWMDLPIVALRREDR